MKAKKLRKAKKLEAKKLRKIIKLMDKVMKRDCVDNFSHDTNLKYPFFPVLKCYYCSHNAKMSDFPSDKCMHCKHYNPHS